MNETMDRDDPVAIRLREAGSRAGTTRPLADVQGRARSIRRRRSAVRAGGGVAVLGLAAACAVALLPVRGLLPDRLESGVASLTGGKDCNTGYAYVGDFADVPALLYLPTGEQGPSESFVRMERSTCAPAPVAAIAYGYQRPGEDSVVARSVVIEGPGARNSYDSSNLGQFMGQTVHEDGVPGDLTSYVMDMDGVATVVSAFWTDQAGTTWNLTPRGMDRDQVRSLVSGLHTGGSTIDPTSLPKELTVVKAADDLVQPERDGWSFSATFGSKDSPDWSLDVRQGTNLAQVRATTPGSIDLQVMVAGRRRDASWSVGKEPTLSFELSAGVVGAIRGLAELDQARSVAAELKAAQPADPRLTSSREAAARDVPRS
jgi:hypothetical protein